MRVRSHPRGDTGLPADYPSLLKPSQDQLVIALHVEALVQLKGLEFCLGPSLFCKTCIMYIGLGLTNSVGLEKQAHICSCFDVESSCMGPMLA